MRLSITCFWILLLSSVIGACSSHDLLPEHSGRPVSNLSGDEPADCRYYLNWPHFYWGTKAVNSTIEGAVWNQNQGQPAVCGNRNVTSCTADGYLYWRGQYFGDGRQRYQICRRPIAPIDPDACTPIPGKNICLADETLLQADVHHSATQLSQAQKVVQNQYGIFAIYAPIVYADPDENTTSSWVMVRSQDGGKTFARVFETSMHRTLPPAVVSDVEGNVYSIHGTGDKWTGPNGLPLWPKDAWFYRFDAYKNFANPTISKIPKGSTDKFDLVFDQKSGNFLFMTFNDTFTTANPIPSFFLIRPDGDVEYSVAMSRMLTTDQKYAKIMYPHLATDGNRIVAAWSTEYDPPGASNPDDPNQTNLYRNVSFVYSDDLGRNWRRFSGDSVSLPMVMDETGPATLVTQSDEIGDHNFLGGIRYINNRLFVTHQVWGKAHPGSHPHFSSFDFGSRTRDIDMRSWNGSTLTADGTGAFVVNPRNPSGPIYMAVGGNYEGKSVLVILTSSDQGRTWQDYAVGSYHEGDPGAVVEVSPSATITADGYIIGAYTRCNSRPEIGRCESYMHGQYILDSRVYFFKVKAK